LILAYVATGVFYSITEVGFRVLAPSWIFLLLAVVSANGVAVGFFGAASRRRAARGTAASTKIIPQRETIYAARRGFYPI
jgi:hypothetical protein